jgi:hypothetical protein
VIKSKHLYNTNNQIHSVHTRLKTNLHPPIANLTKFQKEVYYSRIKIVNNFPHDIKGLANEKTLFWNALKKFLLINSFYNSEEWGHMVAQLVKALRYKSEGCGFDFQWCQWNFSFT